MGVTNVRFESYLKVMRVALLLVLLAASGAAAQPATEAEFVTALLRERRYSLLFEGGHRWIDYRRFGRLSQLPLPRTPRPNRFR